MKIELACKKLKDLSLLHPQKIKESINFFKEKFNCLLPYFNNHLIINNTINNDFEEFFCLNKKIVK